MRLCPFGRKIRLDTQLPYHRACYTHLRFLPLSCTEKPEKQRKCEGSPIFPYGKDDRTLETEQRGIGAGGAYLGEKAARMRSG